jgi:hypothetical protein
MKAAIAEKERLKRLQTELKLKAKLKVQLSKKSAPAPSVAESKANGAAEPHLLLKASARSSAKAEAKLAARSASNKPAKHGPPPTVSDTRPAAGDAAASAQDLLPSQTAPPLAPTGSSTAESASHHAPHVVECAPVRKADAAGPSSSPRGDASAVAFWERNAVPLVRGRVNLTPSLSFSASPCRLQGSVVDLARFHYLDKLATERVLAATPGSYCALSMRPMLLLHHRGRRC